MDKLKAYEILGIQPESSIEEVKEAYAILSKKYHPEEHPEEFQQIHEAYTTLARGNRRRRQTAENALNGSSELGRSEDAERQTETVKNRKVVEEARAEGRKYRQTVEKAEIAKDRQAIDKTKRTGTESLKYEQVIAAAENVEVEKSTEKTYDFEGAVNRAEQEEKQRLYQVAVQALAEFQILLQPEYKEKTKLFKTFFAKKNYAEILKTPEFIGGLAELLRSSFLKKCIYDFIIDFYRLRGYEVSQLAPEAASLYEVLDSKRGMDTKRKENLIYAIPAGVTAGLWGGLRSVARNSQTMGIILLCMVAVIILIWIYRKLYENHSSIFSQAVIAAMLVVISFFTVGFTPDDGVVTFASLLVAAGVLWLAVLAVAAVVIKIKRGVNSKK